MKKDLDAQLGMVKGSKHRKSVLVAIVDGPLCPKEISEKVGYYPSHVSKALSELSSQGLVVCKNPDARKGRLYRLTKDGESICTMLSKCDK